MNKKPVLPEVHVRLTWRWQRVCDRIPRRVDNGVAGSEPIDVSAPRSVYKYWRCELDTYQRGRIGGRGRKAGSASSRSMRPLYMKY